MEMNLRYKQEAAAAVSSDIAMIVAPDDDDNDEVDGKRHKQIRQTPFPWLEVIASLSVAVVVVFYQVRAYRNRR